MINISESAQTHFRKLIEREALPGLGVRLSAVNPGTARADVRLEFAEPADLQGDEWAVDCEGFTLWLDAGSVSYLDGAEIDYETRDTGGQLQIRAPKIKGVVPGDSASLVERVQWLVENEINPQLAQHRGHVSVQEVTFGRRGGLAFWRWLPRLRHGRRDAQAGHREDPAGKGPRCDRGA
jgi:Fe/S biogenesis protein NfuA